ncbi:MAG: ABC transporter permease [Clostridia bacterium]|nr:ABC transporter permease [Clostridia bacterium]
MLKKYNIGSLMTESSLGVVAVVVLYSIFMAIFTDTFLTTVNFFTTSRAFSLWVVVGFSQMMALVIGQLNLSVGAIGGLSGITAGYLFMNTELPVWAVISAGLLVGMACGLINGIIIIRTGINAFIVTLGTFSVFTGIIFGVTGATPYSAIPAAFTFIGRSKVLETIPLVLFVMLAVGLLLYVLFKRTVLGREILATGGNAGAALLSGINTKKVVVVSHVISGLLASLGGILFVARLGAAHPRIGQNWLLMSFAVPIIGGVALDGGRISILGVIFGGILVTFISNGLVLLRVDIFWEQFFLGLVLLIAVGIDRAKTVYIESRYS